MSKVHLIMPMGGAGIRFFINGFITPKPLIEINGKPFFYWAVQSIKNFISDIDLVFVVLQEHIVSYNIDKIIQEYYPNSQTVVIPSVLSGAVCTCLAGTKEIHDDKTIIFNDCDHMFCSTGLNVALLNSTINADGALLTFSSDKPQYSYIRYDVDNNIIGTIEKKVVSHNAICGAYMFRNARLFEEMANIYIEECQYSEYFVSGVYNTMCSRGLKIVDYKVDFHVPFGTPDEYRIAKNSNRFDCLE